MVRLSKNLSEDMGKRLWLKLERVSSPVLRRVCQKPVSFTLMTWRAERCSASTRHATETHILMHVLLRIHPNLSEDSAAERARRPSRLGPSRSHPTMDHCALLVQLDKASTEPEQRQQSQGLNLGRVRGAPKLLHWAKQWPCKELSCSSSSNRWHNEELSNSSNRWHRSSLRGRRVRVRPFVRAAPKALQRGFGIQKCESWSRH